MESEQRVVIGFLLKENANADDIHKRLQAQSTDDPGRIRSVRRWYQSIRHGREDVHDDPRSGCEPIDFIDPRISSVLERELFRSAHSLGEIVIVSYSTVIRRL
jgi:hypothetical protein